ncbi:MAG: HIT family protein [Aristaeellaceae bacterium]
MESCIFCRIARHETPAYMIAEDAHTCCFLDIAMDAEGHLLIIPKKHVSSLLDCDEQTLEQVLHMVKRVADHCVRRGYEGVNLLNASGTCAGQSVPHFHMHLLPRKSGDGLDAWPTLPGTSTPLLDVYDKLKWSDLP